jgi:hypothetical protein
MKVNTKPLSKVFLKSAIALAILFFLPLAAGAQIQITLKDSFIEKFKDRATVDTTFTVDKAHKQPNPASKDGDLHVAGRAPKEVGLAIVAEIMNAKDEDAAVQAIHAAEQTHQPVKLTGAWRIWCEHGGESKQIQGAKLDPFDTTNPDHVFEIHPILSLDGKSVAESLKPIVGFPTKDAEQAFTSYENKKCQIIPNGAKKTTTIVTSMGGFNYVEFRIKLHSAPFQVADGMMVFATVMRLREPGDQPGSENEEDDAVLVRNRLMVFAKGTAPEARVKDLKKDDILHVLGIPRISLKLVSVRKQKAKTTPGILTWNLPYEMLIVGVYDN